MKDRLRKRRAQLPAMARQRFARKYHLVHLSDGKRSYQPRRYRRKRYEATYDEDGWPKDTKPPLWRGTLRRSAKTGMVYRDNSA